MTASARKQGVQAVTRIVNNITLAVTFVGAAGKRIILRAHQPANLVSVALVAVQAIEGGGLPCFRFVKKVTFIHSPAILI